ncbi:hypothetical protein N9E17_01060, partial [bacterium]|nr:hypothetical protein [bacterium]
VVVRETEGHTFLRGFSYSMDDDDDDDDDDNDDNCPDPSSFCGDGTVWDGEAHKCVCLSSCTGDLNFDGIVQLNDLLDLLSVYGKTCDEIEEH